jgi:hypothetical protein
VKNHVRDYATEAFRFYAKINMSADAYKQKIYDEALFNYKKKMKGSGISFPTESAIIAAENEVTQKLAEIKDMEAVEMTLDELRAHSISMNNFGRIDQIETIKAIKIVYFTDPNKELQKGDIQDRVHIAEISIPASERSIYYYLAKARELFALNRGLRI